MINNYYNYFIILFRWHFYFNSRWHFNYNFYNSQ